MENLNLTPEEMAIITEMRQKRESEAEKKERSEAQNYYTSLSKNSRYDDYRDKVKENEFVLKLWKTIEKKDTRGLFFLETEEVEFDPYSSYYRYNNSDPTLEQRFEMVKKYHPDFEPLKKRTYTKYKIFYTVAQNYAAVKRLRHDHKWIAKNNPDLRVRCDIHFTESGGWSSRVTGAKLEGTYPAHERYKKYSVIGYIEAVYTWIDDAQRIKDERMRRKLSVKSEIKMYSALSSVKRIKYMDSDEYSFYVSVSFKNGSWVQVNHHRVERPEHSMYKSDWRDAEPPKRPENYAEVRAYLIKQNS